MDFGAFKKNNYVSIKSILRMLKSSEKLSFLSLFLEAENDYLGVGDDSTRSSFLFSFKFVLYN